MVLLISFFCIYEISQRYFYLKEIRFKLILRNGVKKVILNFQDINIVLNLMVIRIDCF